MIDPAESMGANKTNSILEFLAGKLEQETGIKETMTPYNGPLVKTTYEKNIVNKVHCLIPEEAA